MTVRKILLACGVASSLVYAGADLLAAVRHPEYYSFTARAFSELTARGAPTKDLVESVLLVYDALLVAFGAGVWTSSRRRSVRITAGVLVALGLADLSGKLTSFAMVGRGAAGDPFGVAHTVQTGVLTLLTLALVAAGAFARGRRFRLYSFATLAVLFVFGALTAQEAMSKLAAGEPTPTLGLKERVDIGAFLLWVAAFAISLLRAERTTEPARQLPAFGRTRPA